MASIVTLSQRDQPDVMCLLSSDTRRKENPTVNPTPRSRSPGIPRTIILETWSPSNVFCPYSGSFSLYFFNLCAFACLLRHKAHACPVTLYPIHTTTAKVPPPVLYVKAASRPNRHQKIRHPRPSAWILERREDPSYALFSFTFEHAQGRNTGTITTWDLIGSTYALHFLLFRSEPISSWDEARCAFGCESVSSAVHLCAHVTSTHAPFYGGHGDRWC